MDPQAWRIPGQPVLQVADEGQGHIAMLSEMDKQFLHIRLDLA